MGVSAGGPSVMQTAIRHPERVNALVLVVPIAYKPGTVADSAPPVSRGKDAPLLHLLGSDFLFWAGLHLGRDPLIRHVLATPPEQVAAAQYSASRIPGAKFIGFEDGGHLLVGHDAAVRAEIVKLPAAH